MSTWRGPALAGLLVLLGLGWGAAGAAKADRLSMQINGWANPPVGFVDQCRSHGVDTPVSLSADHWRELRSVNSGVNHSIAPATDLALYQTEEVWTLPKSRGDC